MEKKVEEIINEMEIMEKKLFSMISISDIAEADSESLEMMQNYIRLYNLCKDLLREQAMAVDNMTEKLNVIDNKLDLLLNKND